MKLITLGKRTLALAALGTVLLGVGVAGAVQGGLEPDREMLGYFPPDTDGVLFANVVLLRDVSLFRSPESLGVRIPDEIASMVDAAGVEPVGMVDQVLVGRTGPDTAFAVMRLAIPPAVFEEYFRSRDMASEIHAGHTVYMPVPDDDVGIAFDGAIALAGSTSLIRDALDRRTSGSSSALDNTGLMASIGELESGSQFWGFGTFADSLLPEGVAPPMTTDLLAALESISYQMSITEGVTARLAGRFSSPEAARRAGDLLRGFVAFGKMGSVEQPDIIELLDGVVVQSGEESVEVRFSATEALLERISESGIINRLLN
jgi:hypothetical protein